MSTHAVRIIEIEDLRPHDNAEKLEIVPIGGWQAVVGKGQFKKGDRAVYIEPDYVVPTTRPEFAFLAKYGKEKHRLKAIRLRGVLSFGLLIPVPEDLKDKAVGDDAMEALGIERYIPKRPRQFGPSLGDAQSLPMEDWPRGFTPKFDLENIQNYMHVFKPGDIVFITEKIDGANARFIYSDGKFHVGSRSRWLKPESENIWTKVVQKYPGITTFCKRNTGVTLYGEVYGPVQSLKYGLDEVEFRAFAALRADGTWIDYGDLTRLCFSNGIPWAPVLYVGPFDFKVVKSLAEEDSVIGPPGHMKEGVVITASPERMHERHGRMSLKYISNRFWESEA